MWSRVFIGWMLLFTDPASAGELNRVPDLDFDTRAAGNSRSEGIWSDGTTMWVADYAHEKIYAYNLRTKKPDLNKDFDTLRGAGNRFPQGIWSDGTTMWVADSDGWVANYSDRKIYAYNLRTNARDPNKDFNTLRDAGNRRPQGIWSNGTTMWVADYYDGKIYAYNLRTKARDPNKDFNTLRDAGNAYPHGIWSDGTTMWAADLNDKKIYAYNLRSKARDRAKEFTRADYITVTGGIWSDGMTMWVAGTSFGYAGIYAYNARTIIYAQGIVVERGIQDFPMRISGTRGTLRICVRDHECEDGDRIRVDVDGDTIFSGEIDNDWDCYRLRVRDRESYTVELTALNGTRYKGDCSYADGNTGKIRVTGENTETQVWRHRAGAGSKARIIVERAR